MPPLGISLLDVLCLNLIHHKASSFSPSLYLTRAKGGVKVSIVITPLFFICSRRDKNVMAEFLLYTLVLLWLHSNKTVITKYHYLCVSD